MAYPTVPTAAKTAMASTTTAGFVACASKETKLLRAETQFLQRISKRVFGTEQGILSDAFV
jgi:hypothetical protein